MPYKLIEDRRTYGRTYYAKNREHIIKQRQECAKIYPRKRRRKNFKNKMWCKDEDKPLWKKIFRKWLYYVHDDPEGTMKAVLDIKNRSERSYFEKNKLSDEERKISHKKAATKWRSKPMIRERLLFKRRERYSKNGMDHYYNDIQTRLTALLRGRLYRLTSTKNFRVSHSMLELLGCTIAGLKQHLEEQFCPEMSWDNYGKGEGPRWQVDHVMACRRFDLGKLEHQRVCFHHSNLSPLWTEINCKKDSHPATPKLTDEEVSAMHKKIWGENIVPITTVSEEAATQQSLCSLQNAEAQLGTN